LGEARNTGVQRRIRQYLAKAHQVLDAGRLACEHQDYITAVNRAYYTIFYAANALLASEQLERSKHSGVLAAFRQHFVKTGRIEPEYSDYYGATMDERMEGDYDADNFLDQVTAERALARAEQFLARMERAVQEEGYLT
jgi:uncharacterized protein (UPF0332 family)